MINNKEKILKYFESGIKSTNNLKIGVEHEKFIFDKKTNKRINYNEVIKMFEGLYEFGWKPVYEKKNIIALNKGNKNITLEPGNQIELSGEKLNNIHEICGEANSYLFELKHVLKKLDLKIVSAGFDPISLISEVPNNPKQRYEVMTKDMPLGGSHSLDMMYRTCGTQLNIDYSSEKDFTKKFKLVNSIIPISIALFANSSIVEKNNSSYQSYRSKVWQKTSRAGLPEIFLEDVNFEKYSDFIINYSMLFLQKKERYISGKKYIFSDFMHGRINELNNKFPSDDDLGTHLGTIFTENRLKKYIELRSMDACGWSCLCAGPAFYVGLLYGNLEEALELISNWDKNEIITAYRKAPELGLKTQLMGKDILYWSSQLLNISKKGLEKRDAINKKNENETKYLNHLEKIVNNKETVADNMINRFTKDKNLDELYDK